MINVQNIRELFVEAYKSKNFIKDKTGSTTIELIGQSFLADEDHIFGEVNKDYTKRELEWYLSQSLNVNDIPGETPKIWKQVADPSGNINSNYGWCIFSKDNGNQYENCLQELIKNPDSRRAIMIYNRPTMWKDYCKNGMNEFICTNNVQYFIRNDELIAHVQMRSNDITYGFKNDFFWQKYVLNKLHEDLSYNCTIKNKKIIWISGSLHCYERDYKLIENYIETGETFIIK